MKRPVKSASKKLVKQPESALSGWVIGGQLMDTAWRVAVPIIIFCLIGIKLDKSSGTQPFYTLIGLFLSLVISTLLVYLQIRSLYPDFFNKGKKTK